MIFETSIIIIIIYMLLILFIIIGLLFDRWLILFKIELNLKLIKII